MEDSLWSNIFCSKTSGNNTRTRFDPLLFNWAIALLAKSSHSIYEEIAQVIQLSPLRYVLRKTKEIIDAQNVLKDHGVKLCTVKTMSNNLIGSNKSSGKKITGSPGFDDMYTKTGINWD